MRNDFNEIPGGKWWKMDFHLHTPGSYDYGNGQPDEKKQKECSPKEFLKHCMDKELDCIVVTDHNTVGWVGKLREALDEMRSSGEESFREIVIFPGIEVSVVGNTHLLGIFDPAVEIDELNQIIGNFDFNNEKDGERFAGKSLSEIMNIISRKKGIAIPAHVDKNSGLFHSSSNTIKSVFANTEILAMEVTEQTLTNELYNQSGLHLAYVLGSDSHNTGTIGNQYTWVKMGEPNIEALRLALFDGEDGAIRSISTTDNPNDVRGQLYIKELEIENGKFIGRKEPYKIQFSPWLTNIIGGRGSGKSSILNFIRLLFDKGDELPKVLKEDFNDFAKVSQQRQDLGVLLHNDEEETIIKMTIVVDGIEHLLKWKNQKTYELIPDTGEWKPVVALKQRFPVQIYSQKQLFEMTKDTSLLFRYLDAGWDYDNWKREVEKTTEEFLTLKRKIRTQEKQCNEKKTYKALLRDVEKKIAVFETEDTKAVLEEERKLLQQQQLVKEVYEEYRPLLDSCLYLSNNIGKRKDFNLSSLDSVSRGYVEEWMASMNDMRREFARLVKKYTGICMTYDEYFKSMKLSALIQSNRDKINGIVKELSDSGVNGIDKYPELMAQRKDYKEKIGELGSTEKVMQELSLKAEQCLLRLSDLLQQRIDSRNAVIKSWNAFGKLRVELCPMGDLYKNESAFRFIIGKETEYAPDILDYEKDGETRKGIIADISFTEGEVEEHIETLNRIKKRLINREESIMSKRLARYLSRRFMEEPEIADKLQTWLPEDSMRLYIRVNGKDQPVDIGSPGQRTSAILSLLFAISNTAIIIDQPEDDLDTRNITDIIVEGIKDLKKKQQIILVTHNSNIVVNTNSEQVVQLDFRNGQICNNCSGALQDHAVRDAICNVMEGGKEALEKRYYRIFKALQD